MKTKSHQKMLDKFTEKAKEAKTNTDFSPYKEMFKAAVHAPDTGGGGTCMRILLSLYNGERFKVDLTDLRRLDADLHAVAISVMHDEIGGAYYVHQRIAFETGFSAAEIASKLEWLAYEFGVVGCVKKNQLPAKPDYFDFGLMK